ncbi:MAG: bifunctional adenosylcobinamide kinase/adenosylcobinamide-phosphate guanylyltransferase [bacterium (Candidatus Ratteibacteria) CG_4_10_14_3_um_filter_41_18]|uniref:Adenosylcobinamide kinase n=3 Tax=Candidatus Ratteibacteria TaxID=2979319 RepID=A0A2M7YFK3_9BACT|nr:MAG: bifunctional adenosylcobinamide kinase/adenosylcobinamide-phosphate guanylyltransferase [bacterium (Candidatus Ratteibacteria) CG15_BIG_FIL_POST_REV_8_21_14_020_41_12]PIX77863.1 MAG: bifunctional adenosylcobinamide kinase/adenosylcobinamide-phosphate guanylyltransferase [bacterium (Candidatus Ratteibacteria) CG_4_10_14_3_um_filter_41_18]PJA61746.1 MAG: bifunctional adenosylcobinamide kinase/adenosylcobinamide-phosphate guanylyltransferase [bacterium (Candidatus Ratteibacteria) CG_4_9_14_3
MGKIIFVTGGARSGKSKFALKLAKKFGKKVIFLATGLPKDREMEIRIKIHQKSRPKDWRTIVEEKDVLKAIKGIKDSFCRLLLIDCLTLFVSNLLLADKKEKEILTEVRNIVKLLRKAKYTTIIVSNEVGDGVVPVNKLARRFRDVAGLANQTVAENADEVYLAVAGIPIKVK